jgi:hypothetical protein
MLADPFEKQNIASSHPEKTKELKKQFLDWQASTKASFERPRIWNRIAGTYRPKMGRCARPKEK